MSDAAIGRALGADAAAPAASVRLGPPRPLLRLLSDAALAYRYAAGEEAAFRIIYERHRTTVLAVCMGILGSRHDAEDAAQEVFASLAVVLQGGQPRELRPWLVRVARNAAIDIARRRRPRATVDEAVHEPVAPSCAGPDELASVLAAIRQLPRSQRMALLMRELGGHSYAEIATLLDTNEQAVRGLIARARIGLRNQREASELPCNMVRDAIVSEPDGRRLDKGVRRHLRTCPSCRAWRKAVRSDARALRAAFPVHAGGFAGGGLAALAGKTAFIGGALTQATVGCAVSACAFGGIVLLDRPAAPVNHRARHETTLHRGQARVVAGALHPAASALASSGASLARVASNGRHVREVAAAGPSGGLHTMTSRRAARRGSGTAAVTATPAAPVKWGGPNAQPGGRPSVALGQPFAASHPPSAGSDQPFAVSHPPPPPDNQRFVASDPPSALGGAFAVTDQTARTAYPTSTADSGWISRSKSTTGTPVGPTQQMP